MAHLQRIIMQLLGFFALFALRVGASFTQFTSIDAGQGTKWAVLVAGSTGYENYRHQANVCHAYQILKKGGLKEENIIVFMYDDVAFDKENPRPGVLINRPGGKDVYAGVKKDYTGEDVNEHNILAAILGDYSTIIGGSKKVVNSGRDDYILLYFTDHGGSGRFVLPNYNYLYAESLNKTLRKKHESGTYKQMMIYFDCCHSGSMFEGLLSNDMNIYVATSAKPDESSSGTYCNEKSYNYTCLSTQFSAAWMEDSDQYDRATRTLAEQYEVVKKRVTCSNATQYGDTSMTKDTLSTYMGTQPSSTSKFSSSKFSDSVGEYDVDIYILIQKASQAFTSTSEKKKEDAERELYEALNKRAQIHDTFTAISVHLFGKNKGPKLLNQFPKPGQPVVNDWDCYRKSVETYDKYCGSSTYALKYTGLFANMCNAGGLNSQLAQAVAKACR
ncbi:hypothetical protein Ancab_022981 [Ancistrocladus abbreviatus]